MDALYINSTTQKLMHSYVSVHRHDALRKGYFYRDKKSALVQNILFVWKCSDMTTSVSKYGVKSGMYLFIVYNVSHITFDTLLLDR